jgi:ABC-type branched-subunit amino acid transport system substrate-binding protein
MRRRTGAVALLIALSLVAAACGNDKKTDAGGTTGGGGASDVGVTDTEIKVGLLVSATGGSATAQVDFDKGFEAYIERLNANGGVFGRKIKVVDTRDDGGDPARNKVEMENLFNQGVFTVLGSWPQFGAMEYIEQNKLPIIGTNFDGPTWEKTEWALGTGGNWKDTTPTDDPPPLVSGLPFYVMGKLGATKLAVFSYDHPGSRAASENVCKAAKDYGMTCVFEDYTLPFGFTDVDGSVAKVKASGADFMYGGMDAGGALSIVRSLKRSGIDIPTMWAVLPSPEQAAASSDLIGNLYGVQGAPPFDGDNPEMKLMVAEVAKRKPGTKLSFAVANGWDAGHLFEVGLKAAGKNLTRQGLYKAIRSMNAYTNAWGTVVDFTQSPEDKQRAGIKPDAAACAGFLMRGDPTQKKMVQVGEKPVLCAAGVLDAASLKAKLAKDTSSLKVSG